MIDRWLTFLRCSSCNRTGLRYSGSSHEASCPECGWVSFATWDYSDLVNTGHEFRNEPSLSASKWDRFICKQVSKIVRSEGKCTSSCHIVEDEVDYREYKALIGDAELAIVSRYHAFVAALSSGVLVICIRRNEKYKDLLDFHKPAEFAVDARMREPNVDAEVAINHAKH